MNHSYRVIWNVVTSTWQAVAETAKGRGKSKSVAQGVAAATLLLAGATVAAGPLPTGGNIVAGSGAISQSGSTMTINQSTAKMAVNWDSFSVGQGNTVNFVQPSASAVALNRVLGSDVSVIQGAINANGQVFLLNPNGVLFTPTAQVNVGALMASTLKMSTDDFMAGNYKLSGDSSNAVINQGNITAVGDAGKGGAIALIAAKVINEGNLTANSGNVLLGAGSEVLLDLGGPVKLQVTQGAIDALVQNSGAIQADGGLIYLTAQAVNTLTAATINNTGVIRAQTLATGEKGEIRLMADMGVGTVNVGGTLDASAPNGGDGGFIETSGATVKADASLRVDTSATDGKAGLWLIDPVDITIGAAGSNILASTVSAALNSGNVTISTSGGSGGIGTYTSGPTGSQTTTDQAGTSGAGDITVSSAISKTAGGASTLTLLADRNIEITSGADITSSTGALNVTLRSGLAAGATSGGIKVNANILTNGGDILMGGGASFVPTVPTGGSSVIDAALGFARNFDAGLISGVQSYGAAVEIGAVTVYSNGGKITLQGYSTQNTVGNLTNSPYLGSGVLFNTPATLTGEVVSGTGALNVVGVSSNNDIFGVAFAGLQNSTTVVGNGKPGISGSTNSSDAPAPGGSIRLEGWNTAGANGAYLDDHSFYLAQRGQARNLLLQGYSAQDLAIFVNGSQANVLYNPARCGTVFPACGYLEVPTANGSYPYIGYNMVTLGGNYLTITTTPSVTRVYDGTTRTITGTETPSFSYSITGTAPGDFPSLTFATPSANVGAYTSLNLSNTLTGGLTSSTRFVSSSGTTYSINYSFGTYSITPASLQISGANNTRTYNGAAQTNIGATMSVNGVAYNGVNGTTVTTGLGSDSFTLSGYGSGTNARSTAYADAFQLAANGSTNAGNYTITYTNGGLTINPAPLGVALSATYNGTSTFTVDPQITTTGSVTTGGTLKVTGLKGSDTLGAVTVDDPNVSTASLINGISGSAGTTLWNGTNGNYIINTSSTAGNSGTSANGVYSGTNSSNSNSGGTNQVSLSRATLEIAGANNTVTYSGGTQTNSGATELVNGVAYNGVSGNTVTTGLGGDSFTLSGYGSGTNARSTAYADAFQLAANGSTNAGNYTITYTNGGLTINPAPLGVALSATYNGTSTFTVDPQITTTGSVTTGGTLKVSGLKGSDTLGAVTVDDPNVSTASLINGISGSAGTTLWNGTNGNYIINTSSTAGNSGTSANGVYSGTNSSNSNSGGTNQVSLSRATLEIAGANNTVTYNGYSQTNSGATRSVNGGAASSIIGAAFATGLGTDSLTLSGYGHGTNASNTPYADNLLVSGTAAGNYNISYTNGGLTINRAPLGVAVSGAYNGTTLYTNGVNGTLINTVGLVGGDVGKRVGTATLDSATLSGTSYVASIDSSDFNVNNYVLFGARSPGSTGQCVSGVCSGTNNGGANAGGTNTVAIAVLQPPPAAPIVVPAFPDNGIKAIANDTRPPEFGGMNYVAALFEGATPTTTSPTATGQTQGAAPTASAAPTQGGAMNYVSISSKVTDAGQELQVRLPEDKNRKPQSELNVNNTTVSSNTSPLDVFVVDTGINLSNLNNGK